jgi:hypothetical protein
VETVAALSQYLILSWQQCELLLVSCLQLS